LLSSPRRVRAADSLPGLARALLLHNRVVVAPAVVVVRVAAAVGVVEVVAPRQLLLQRPLRVGLMERSG
jgi:hypothetical protein